jgi:hypothetical protein
VSITVLSVGAATKMWPLLHDEELSSDISTCFVHRDYSKDLGIDGDNIRMDLWETG